MREARQRGHECRLPPHTTVETARIRPPPDVAEAAAFAEVARGIAIVDEKLITILDVDGVFPA
ncbi:MAG TPA: hypothetical protein PKN91_11605, partial [Steroidobacteraceae bacterium]|nr:hypothetical protein [Steroidobacteraceae bacterium]